MTKWALSKANDKKNTSVLKQLDSAHKQIVLSNQKNLQVVIECLMFAAQQNVAIRGHEEDRKNIWEVSDINIAGFFATESTEGEVLYELVKKAVTSLNLQLRDIVGECFDGAANMSGCNKGVASRMKECSPLALYVNCYAHRLNLALQDTMTSVQPIRNALGTI